MDEALEKRVWEMFEQGLSDNEVLDKIVSQEGESITYMDLRVLRADYETEHPESIAQDEDDVKEDLSEDETDETETGQEGTAVTIDTVKKPGTLLSGKASLPSGAEVVWMLDQYGRINIQPESDARPTQADLQAFQMGIKRELEKRGGVI